MKKGSGKINVVLMISNGWNLISFGTGQQPNKCYVDKVLLMMPTHRKREEQTKRHHTDHTIFNPSDSPQPETVTGDAKQTSWTTLRSYLPKPP